MSPLSVFSSPFYRSLSERLRYLFFSHLIHPLSTSSLRSNERTVRGSSTPLSLYCPSLLLPLLPQPSLLPLPFILFPIPYNPLSSPPYPLSSFPPTTTLSFPLPFILFPLPTVLFLPLSTSVLLLSFLQTRELHTDQRMYLSHVWRDSMSSPLTTLYHPPITLCPLESHFLYLYPPILYLPPITLCPPSISFLVPLSP